ncbi:MAG: dihydrofolate reductase family protein [Roseibium sp.]
MSNRPTYVGYIAMSLDGFIAGPDGSIEWLDPFNLALGADGSDGGYSDFIGGIDALMVGRKTYEQVMGWGWPYETRPAYVLTRDTGFSGEHVAAAGNINALGEATRKAGHKRIWVMGGGEAQRVALDAGLFDKLRVFVMPTLLGGGLPCFAPGSQHNLALLASEQMAGGILHIEYDIKD